MIKDSLVEWLERHNAKSAGRFNTEAACKSAAHFYVLKGGAMCAVLHLPRGGWDLFVQASSSNERSKTLEAAERILGLAPVAPETPAAVPETRALDIIAVTSNDARQITALVDEQHEDAMFLLARIESKEDFERIDEEAKAVVCLRSVRTVEDKLHDDFVDMLGESGIGATSPSAEQIYALAFGFAMGRGFTQQGAEEFGREAAKGGVW